MISKDRLARELRGLMNQEGDLYFQYAERAREAASEDELRAAGEQAGWFENREWSTLVMYMRIGLAFKEGGWVADRSWTAHAECYSHPDRYAILAKCKTKREIRRATGKKAMLDDKDAREEAGLRLLSDDAILARAAEIRLTAYHKARESHKEKIPGIIAHNDVLEVESDLSRASSALDRVLTTLMDTTLDAAAREMLASSLEDLTLRAGWVKAALTGEENFEEGLDRLLAE